MKMVAFVKFNWDKLNIGIESDHLFRHDIHLDEKNVIDSRKDPERVLKNPTEKLIRSNSLQILPYGIVVIEWSTTKIDRFDRRLRWNTLIKAGGAVVNDEVYIECNIELQKQT